VSSDTPRTDVHAFYVEADAEGSTHVEYNRSAGYKIYVYAAFARGLERELAEVNRKLGDKCVEVASEQADAVKLRKELDRFRSENATLRERLVAVSAELTATLLARQGGAK
jgi:hypothetical protein